MRTDDVFIQTDICRFELLRISEYVVLLFLSCSDTCVRLSTSLFSQGEMNMYKDVCYYMLFALAAYGWPMYLMRKPACGLCRLASSCP